MTNIIYQFLRRAQKYTSTDNIYLAKGGSWLTLGQVFSLAASFLLAIVFANLLDPVTFGNYKYILSLVGIFGISSLAGIETAAMQAVARGLEGSFYSGFKTKLRWSLLGSAAAIGGAIYYWLQGNEILSIPLLIAAVFSPLLDASHIYTSFLGGRKLFNIQIKWGIVCQIITTGALILTLFLTKSLFWLIMVYFVSNALPDYFFYLLAKIKFRPNKEEDPQTLSFGKHLSFIGALGAAANYLDKIFLFTLAGSPQLAIYSFATLLPEQIRAVIANINTLAFPKLAVKSREEIKKNLMKKFWKLSLLTGVVIIIYILVAPYFFKIFFPQYLASISYSQVFMLTFISLPVSLLGTVFQAKMMKKSIYFLKIFSSLTKIILFAILIPLYGVWGLIIALICNEILNSFLTLFLFRRM